MNQVRAKKNLGQHFLKDLGIAAKIVDSLKLETTRQVLEVGPGMGVLTQFLIEKPDLDLKLIEIDRESVAYLNDHFPDFKERIISGDFLRIDLTEVFNGKFAVIGNFPYNISSQIFFKVLKNKDQVPEVVGMLQKEVAERICAGPGSKTYGILSVLLQAFYNLEYLFTVNEIVFSPPPKVKSAVVRLTRNQVEKLDCDEDLFLKVVKTAFNQRRKMLRNSLKSEFGEVPTEFETFRPEQLGVGEFIRLTSYFENVRKAHAL
jgi:16S rRNA (adenine1518-N6/adenine1519-N6)-dimethyltransferase